MMKSRFRLRRRQTLIRRVSSSFSLSLLVHDFSAMICKDNRWPDNSNILPGKTYFTPPPCKQNCLCFLWLSSSIRGSISASGNTQKSSATVEDLKKISIAAASAINSGGRKSLGDGRGRTSFGVCGGRGWFCNGCLHFLSSSPKAPSGFSLSTP